MKTLQAFLILCLYSCVSLVTYAESTAEFEARGIIMIDKRGNLVRFFDPVTFKEISNLAIDGTPHELALSPDRNTAYVPNYGDGVYGRNPNPGQSIAVIDLATRKVRHTIDISPYQAPHGIMVDRAGTLYVSCDISRKLLVINPNTFAIDAAIDTVGEGHWVVVTPDGKKAYTANKRDKLFVSAIDIPQQKVVAEIAMPNGTQGIGISPDGQYVLAIDMAEPRMMKIDTTTDKVIENIALPNLENGAWDAEVSPNGQFVTVISARERKANLYRANNLQAPLATLTAGSQPFGVEYTPDGKSVLVSNHGDGTVSVFDLASQQLVNTINAGTGIETLAYY